ncbi:MAG TPA: hypothetical protein VNU95_00995 [Candidatus Acidoferrales bacterium]|jgi:hypothetical protein|nr:hypothetical protein [Candidatus Acidoferrales bacterium]
MKPFLLLLAIMSCVPLAVAQPVGVTATNQIIFPLLLSTNESTLMTNAEFRCTQGIKVFFRNSDGSIYQSFNASEIDSNQLAQMGLSLATMEDAQGRLVVDRQQFAQQEAAGQAAFAAAQAAQAEQEAQANAASQESTNQTASSSSSTNTTKKTHHHHQ